VKRYQWFTCRRRTGEVPGGITEVKSPLPPKEAVSPAAIKDSNTQAVVKNKEGETKPS
jgi:hypothetical protein